MLCAIHFGLNCQFKPRVLSRLLYFKQKDIAMITVSILYPNTSESTFNLDYYMNNHVPMVERLLKPMGLQDVVVEQSVGTPMPGVPAPFSIVARLDFNNVEEMEMGMGHHGEALMRDIPNFSNVQPIVQIGKRLK